MTCSSGGREDSSSDVGPTTRMNDWFGGHLNQCLVTPKATNVVVDDVIQWDSDEIDRHRLRHEEEVICACEVCKPVIELEERWAQLQGKL